MLADLQIEQLRLELAAANERIQKLSVHIAAVAGICERKGVFSPAEYQAAWAQVRAEWDQKDARKRDEAAKPAAEPV